VSLHTLDDSPDRLRGKASASASDTQFTATYAVLAVMCNELLSLIARRVLPVRRLGYGSAPMLFSRPHVSHSAASSQTAGGPGKRDRLHVQHSSIARASSHVMSLCAAAAAECRKSKNVTLIYFLRTPLHPYHAIKRGRTGWIGRSWSGRTEVGRAARDRACMRGETGDMLTSKQSASFSRNNSHKTIRSAAVVSKKIRTNS